MSQYLPKILDLSEQITTLTAERKMLFDLLASEERGEKWPVGSRGKLGNRVFEVVSHNASFKSWGLPSVEVTTTIQHILKDGSRGITRTLYSWEEKNFSPTKAN